MKHLIIYAHPNSASFNHAILTQVKSDLTAKGHEVIVRDLYAENFNPVLSAKDFGDLQQGKIPQDIEAEQKHIQWADTITLIYPVWWSSMPAILKGYIDRIFLTGFAYSFGEDGQVIPLLSDKNLLAFSTHGAPSAYYAQGMYNAFEHTVDQGIAGFVGLKLLKHTYFGEVPTTDDATRQKMLTEVTSTLNSFC